MKKQAVVLCLSLVAALPAWAEKPEWAGEGKSVAGQKETHREAMKDKDRYTADDGDWGEKDTQKHKKEKKVKDAGDEKPEKMKGLEKQTVKKSEQTQKELDKGSEQGQAAREERKKWWKFWE
jgi:hypothetical protein